ncbi:hypothetical protein GCM10023161_45040 [Mycobacterium paraffinicum]|uniref:Uncharacterized protein n=1 Tax=Mycobacterium paraffinicum TaxID=53378 RepID=A0ABP8F4J8_9MYCO
MLVGIEQLRRRQPSRRIGGHGHQHPLQPRAQRFDAGGVEDVGVEFDAQAQFVARHGLQCQRVVGGFAGGDVGDGQFADIQRRGGVDRVVLVDEQGVEELVVARDAVHLGKRQVLVFQRVVVVVPQLVEQVDGAGGRGDGRAHRDRVDQQADHRFRAGHVGRPAGHRGAEGDVMVAGQPHQQLRPRRLQHGIDGGVT